MEAGLLAVPEYSTAGSDTVVKGVSSPAKWKTILNRRLHCCRIAPKIEELPRIPQHMPPPQVTGWYEILP